IDITHPLPSDLRVYLFSPDGVDVRLLTGICTTGPGWTSANTRFNLRDNVFYTIGAICPPGPDTYQSSQALSRVFGRPIGGTWTLQVTDLSANGQTGTLNGWGLRLHSSP